MKQTAVEWLVEQLKERGYAGEFPPHLLFEQAKEMHKQEIIDTYIIADSESTIEDSEHNAEQYYKKHLS
jgi:hypothetical protein